MAGFWDATAGTVSFGGQPIQKIPFDQLMGEISYVAQDNFLFDKSIRENIRMGNPAATDQEVEAAAKAANCHEFTWRWSRAMTPWPAMQGTGSVAASASAYHRPGHAEALLCGHPG